jgi:peptidoglycan/xylan/chitin deacetylase (PgdA/CDA1 family)
MNDPRHDPIPERVRARDLVGYGPTPPPFTWPGAAKVIINLVLVYEEGSEYSVLWGDDRNDGWGEYPDPGVAPPQRDPGTEGHYDYGSRAGVWRLARIYDAAGVPVTISGSAAALELNPPLCEWIRDHDHDVLGHGWRWIEAWTQSRDEEREYLLRAVDSFQQTIGSRPIGWNCRSWPSENTRDLLIEEGGFVYDSDVCADDIPYYARHGDRQWLVVPYSKTYNDARFVTNPGFASPRDYLETLTMGLDQLRGESAISMMTVVAHARWSGQAARAAVMREFIAYAQQREDVAFMRRDDIARWWLEHHPPAGVRRR